MADWWLCCSRWKKKQTEWICIQSLRRKRFFVLYFFLSWRPWKQVSKKLEEAAPKVWIYLCFGESLDYKGRNALFIYTRCNAGFPGLSFQAPGASDENQLSQVGVGPYCSAEPDINISCPEFAGICEFPSSDDNMIALVSCHQHNLSAEPGGGQSFWWARSLACFSLLTQTNSVALTSSYCKWCCWTIFLVCTSNWYHKGIQRMIWHQEDGSF